MVKKKYFFFDIDGTLAIGNPGRYIPESTKRTIQKLKEEGHFLAIATGRSYAMAKAYLDEFQFENMVCDGGNAIVLNKTLIDSKPLDKDQVIQLIEELEDLRIPWGISLDISNIRYSLDNRFYEFTKDTYMKTVVNPSLDIYQVDHIYKVYVACYQAFEDHINMLKVLPHARYHKEYLFVEPDDKSIGIKMMMDHFNAPYEDVVVFGDASNDLKMFIPEWTSIAMGNGIEALKERATYVTKRADEDGIEYACRHFGWIK